MPEETERAAQRRRYIGVLAWSVAAVLGGAVTYSLFARLSGFEASLIGVPVGIVVGQFVHRASGKRGGRRYQLLAILLAYLAFDLTYAPGMAGVSLTHGITVGTALFFVFMTAVSPAIDPQNGFLGHFMVLAGMYLAWTLARARKGAAAPQ